MANVKQVEISGVLPFDCTEHDGMCKVLGQLQQPTLGIKFSWNRNKAATMVPNEHNGHTAYYSFEIVGEEAVSWEYLDMITDNVVGARGVITKARARDIEENSNWILLRNQPGGQIRSKATILLN